MNGNFDHESQEELKPTFGIIMIGGALVGSIVRDMRIAHELVNRGYQVHIFWAIDEIPPLEIDPRIKQHLLFQAARYNGILMTLFGWQYSHFDDMAGRAVISLFPFKLRSKWYKRGLGGFDFVKWSVNGLIRSVCQGIENDKVLMKRFARVINREKITHLLPNLSVFAPFCHAVKPYVEHELKYLNIFQGYEVYANFASDIGLCDQLFEKLVEGAKSADYPTITVSEDYKKRVKEDLGLSDEYLTVLSACVDIPELMTEDRARELVGGVLKGYQSEKPLITYMGRQDYEKGIDLLLYAVKILKHRGHDFQLAICGTTAWGNTYRDTCRRIADNLRLDVLEADYISDDERTALYRASHCIVYPSIHREPFGMVPVEAMAQSTPVVVPNLGGVSNLPFSGDKQAGLTFRAWDSADLADQIQSLLTDDSQYEAFRADARSIAEQYSAERVTDLELDLMGLLPQPTFEQSTSAASTTN